MSKTLTTAQIEAAKEAGFYWHPVRKGLVVRHSSGSWVSVDDMLARFVALLATQQPEPRDEVTDVPVPDWMTCESRRPFVVNSIRARSEELRHAERRCRNAYRKDFMGIPTQYVADAYGEAAAVLEARLVAIDAARAGGA